MAFIYLFSQKKKIFLVTQIDFVVPFFFCFFAYLSISLSGPMRMPDGLDEVPGAYKDIAQVIANERDLVKPLVELAPMAVIKG